MYKYIKIINLVLNFEMNKNIDLFILLNKI
jgi:hypothetical protein